MKFNAGVFFGVFIISGLCSIFSMWLYDILPSIKPVMVYVGAAYILWLAWQTYNSEPNDKNGARTHTNTFLYGLVLQFVNPNTIIYLLMTISTFIIPNYKSALILFIFTSILAFMGFLATCCWSLFGVVFKRFFIKSRKLINTIMALLLVYCAISLII